MRIEVKIVDDNGDILAEHKADASQPSMWRAPSGMRFVSEMPRQSDAKNTGTYDLYGITFQPHVRIDRPNGYEVPIPFSGSPFAAPPVSAPPPSRAYPNPLSGATPISKGNTWQTPLSNSAENSNPQTSPRLLTTPQ